FAWSLAFAPDGRSLVSGSWDATALVWDLTGRDVAQQRREPWTADELAALWTALGNAKSEEGHRAVLALANAPTQAVPFLRTRLTADPPPDVKGIAKWLADLDDEEFEVRERASHALARLGKVA